MLHDSCLSVWICKFDTILIFIVKKLVEFPQIFYSLSNDITIGKKENKKPTTKNSSADIVKDHSSS